MRWDANIGDDTGTLRSSKSAIGSLNKMYKKCTIINFEAYWLVYMIADKCLPPIFCIFHFVFLLATLSRQIHETETYWLHLRETFGKAHILLADLGISPCLYDHYNTFAEAFISLLVFYVLLYNFIFCWHLLHERIWMGFALIIFVCLV